MGNTIINPDQSNTKPGGIEALANEDLTGKRSYLGVLVNDTGALEVKLPDTASELAIVLIDDEGKAGDAIPLTPINSGENIRVYAKGTGDPGTVLVLADPSTPTDAGKVRAVPATEGVYFSPGIAEEAFVDGQLVLVRPLPRLVHVGAAFTGATPAATPATNSTPFGYSEAQANAILATVRELRAWAIANGFKADNA